MIRGRHDDDCAFAGPIVTPCIICACLHRARSEWNASAAVAERIAYDSGRKSVADAILGLLIADPACAADDGWNEAIRRAVHEATRRTA